MPIFRPRKFTFFPCLILFKRIESIDMTPCVISFLVSNIIINFNIYLNQSRTNGPINAHLTIAQV